MSLAASLSLTQFPKLFNNDRLDEFRNIYPRNILSLPFQNSFSKESKSFKGTAIVRSSRSDEGKYEPIYVDDDDNKNGQNANLENAERPKGIFSFVTDNPSSKSSIQLPNTPAQDGNLGQMISAIEDKGRDFGSYIKGGKFNWFVRQLDAKSGNPKNTKGDVLFLHGAPTQSYCYRVVMSQLSEKGYSCIAPDWIGFGFSDKPQPGYGFNYTEDEYHQELDQLIEELEIAQPLNLVVQGFILGSYGLTWALKNKDKIAKLAILNTPLTPSAPLPSIFQQLRLPFVGEFACQNAILAERFIEGGSPYVLDLDDADVYRLPYLDSGAPGFSLLEASRKANLKDVYSRIREGFSSQKWDVPTVVAWGDKDKYLKQSEASEFAAGNPDVVRVAILEGAGHLPQEDWPEKVVQALCNIFD